MTESQIKALIILSHASYESPMSSAGFADRMWPDSNMHYKTSNQGNGACKGKAGWLCGGSYIGKLKKKGWIATTGNWHNLFYLSFEGKKALKSLNIPP